MHPSYLLNTSPSASEPKISILPEKIRLTILQTLIDKIREIKQKTPFCSYHLLLKPNDSLACTREAINHATHPNPIEIEFKDQLILQPTEALSTSESPVKESIATHFYLVSYAEGKATFYFFNNHQCLSQYSLDEKSAVKPGAALHEILQSQATDDPTQIKPILLWSPSQRIFETLIFFDLISWDKKFFTLQQAISQVESEIKSLTAEQTRLNAEIQILQTSKITLTPTIPSVSGITLDMAATIKNLQALLEAQTASLFKQQSSDKQTELHTLADKVKHLELQQFELKIKLQELITAFNQPIKQLEQVMSHWLEKKHKLASQIKALSQLQQQINVKHLTTIMETEETKQTDFKELADEVAIDFRAICHKKIISLQSTYKNHLQQINNLQQIQTSFIKKRTQMGAENQNQQTTPASSVELPTNFIIVDSNLVESHTPSVETLQPTPVILMLAVPTPISASTAKSMDLTLLQSDNQQPPFSPPQPLSNFVHEEEETDMTAAVAGSLKTLPEQHAIITSTLSSSADEKKLTGEEKQARLEELRASNLLRLLSKQEESRNLTRSPHGTPLDLAQRCEQIWQDLQKNVQILASQLLVTPNNQQLWLSWQTEISIFSSMQFRITRFIKIKKPTVQTFKPPLSTMLKGMQSFITSHLHQFPFAKTITSTTASFSLAHLLIMKILRDQVTLLSKCEAVIKDESQWHNLSTLQQYKKKLETQHKKIIEYKPRVDQAVAIVFYTFETSLLSSLQTIHQQITFLTASLETTVRPIDTSSSASSEDSLPPTPRSTRSFSEDLSTFDLSPSIITTATDSHLDIEWRDLKILGFWTKANDRFRHQFRHYLCFISCDDTAYFFFLAAIKVLINFVEKISVTYS